MLFYDTANLSQYLSDCTDEIYCIVDKLLCVENMYSISLDISLLDHTFNWINNLVDNGYAYFHEDCRCLSLPPNLLISSECDQKRMITYIVLLLIGAVMILMNIISNFTILYLLIRKIERKVIS